MDAFFDAQQHEAQLRINAGVVELLTFMVSADVS